MFFTDNLTTYSILLLALNLCLIIGLRFAATSINLLDSPGGRKTHTTPTPLIGGIAIYLTMLAAISIKNDWDSDIGVVILWTGFIVVIGLIDDLKNVHWFIRICVQIISALGVITTTGIKVTHLGTYPFIGPIELGPMSTVFTIFSVVALTNAFNLIDGIDGLCGSLILLPLSALMVISYWFSGNIDFYFSILVALLAIFLSFNLSKKTKHKIFLGDAGSTGLGFLISFVVITHINDEKVNLMPPFALWLLLIPISDTIHVIARRILDRKSIFQPSTNHFHHRLMAMGFSQSKSLSILLILAILGKTVGIFLNSISDAISICVFFLTLVFFPAIIISKKHNTAKKYIRK